MSRFLGFFAVFAALWALQLYATYQQSIVFMRTVNRMRAGGETAICTPYAAWPAAYPEPSGDTY